MAQDCLFCKIVDGQIPAQVVYQDDQVLAFRDINPMAPTHILIIPKRHIPDVMHLAETDGALLGHIYAIAADLARQEGVDQRGFRVVVNNGPDAGQTVHHIHFHVLGGRELGWPPG